ncbi:MAG: tripartite tricarboxylate transporter substrate-binding protein, partial [Caldimonas sp.]
ALVFTGAGTIEPHYSPLTDLAPVSQVVITPNLLVVGNDVAAKSVHELIAMIRARPDAFNCAHVGAGTSSQRACDLLSESAGLDLVQVPFTKSPLPDVVAGRVQIFFANIAAAMPMVREGQLRALAVSSLTRSPVAPALPTMAEAGLPGFEAVAWFGLLAPAGTPELVVRRLQSETKHALQETALNSRLIELGTLPVGSSPQEFAALLRAETKRWSGVRPATPGPRR